MKKILIAFAIPLALAAPAHAANMCVDIRDIDSSKSTDGRILVFKMKDGTTLVNHLQGYCPDLKFFGFAWRTHTGDTKVCEREQSFQVIQSPQVCVLGKFDPPVTTKVWDINRRPAPPPPDLEEHGR